MCLDCGGDLLVSNGNRRLPSIVLLVGIVLFFAPIGFFKVAGIALLAVIIWIANKWDWT